ncbi:PREDICTED: mas-related G-protein coupled receptor MRG-like [Chrysochloris asiatica]|uniref:Mas-related G-protein coupled receptor MRG-like n=1 Tax=Chrysochloris asiatica TaxID=185453 RepID=A0A9B0TC55_CHRAS|nr:PREDICTED: mas-related G-protein coupled receptor MRG-like [Chrysochloris asiatica]
MDLLLTSPSWGLNSANDTGGPVDTATSDSGREEFCYMQIIFPGSMVVSLGGMVGNVAIFWLLWPLTSSNPYAIYTLNLVAADILNLFCISGILLEQSLTLYRGVTPRVAVLLSPVSCFFDTVGLCLLAATSVENALRSLFPTWLRCQRPKHTSATMCALTWVLALGWHVAMEVCSNFEGHPACECFFQAFMGFYIFVCLVMCVSSLALSVRGCRCPQRCRPSRVYYVVRVMATTALLWGLPFVIILYLPELEDLTLNLHLVLVLILSVLASVMHPLIYFLVGYLGKNRRKEPLKKALQRALLSEMELVEGESGVDLRARVWKPEVQIQGVSKGSADVAAQHAGNRWEQLS